MDRVLAEYMSILSLDYRIVGQQHDASDGTTAELFLPRWDLLQRSMAWVYLRQLSVSPSLSRLESWATLIKILRQEKYIALTSGIASRRLMNDLAVLKGVIRNKLSDQLSDSPSRRPYLILDRSPPPEAYAGQDSRTAREYGTATRSLRGVEEKIEQLRHLGHPVERFEPGQASQVEQIVRFSNARGVIAIRGAELANMHWLKPGSKLIVLRPQHKLSTHLYGMARLLHLNLQELACDEPHPDLAQFSVEQYL